MRNFMLVLAAAFCAGCMFVTESYAPGSVGGYEVKGSCVGLTWDQCRGRAEDLCAQAGQKVASIKTTGGVENDPGFAIIPKRVTIECTD